MITSNIAYLLRNFKIRPTPPSPRPFLPSVTSPVLPSYISAIEKPAVLPRSSTAGAFVAQQPVPLVQSKTRAKAKAKSEKGGSKIFEHYQCTVTKRTQHPEGNMQRRLRRTTSCGSLEMLEHASKSNQVSEHKNLNLTLKINLFMATLR